MNIVCVICRELLLPSEDIFHTPCGHIFHFPCLTQWLERSKTCPQCREKVSQAKIHRLYFNFSNNDSISEDSTTLQSRVESLEFKLLLKEKDIKHYVSKAETADKQVHGLRKEIGKLENEIALKNSANFALNEQVMLLRENHKIMNEQKHELERLRKHVELSRNVQTLLSSSYDNVDEMIKETRDPQTFITYIKVLKQELLCCTNKRKEQRTMIKNLHQDISSLTKERNIFADELAKRKNLDEQLAISESKRLDLKRRLKMYEKNDETSDKEDESNVITNSEENKKSKEELVRKLNDDDLEDIPKAKKLKPSLKEKYSLGTPILINDDDVTENPKSRNQYLLGSPIVISEDSSDEGATSNSTTRKTKGNEENSPYLRLKSKGISALKELHAQRSSVGVGHSIFRKKKLSNASTIQKGLGPASFDGFGGHSRPELFPVMNSKQKKITPQDAVKAKRAKLDDTNKKLGEFLINLV
ncbi:E3 ubiquitin-protein ligase TRAIP-like [Leptopilina boulardi]|uniref:E3 ubiquitin-protein ligase TRAIP-like n=1 Tax=Leptopilina boulardi TaxID=63433 RepID=UPI0021F5711D|nr:E3 ubiquitin-protein ligase TRAIP-like [Leptopilina boulardi]